MLKKKFSISLGSQILVYYRRSTKFARLGSMAIWVVTFPREGCKTFDLIEYYSRVSTQKFTIVSVLLMVILVVDFQSWVY